MLEMRSTVCIIAAVLVAAASAVPSDAHKAHKRQIFREQVSPHMGGKIPEDAFRTDRLALNRLNKEGISVPDGVLLQQRHRESHHSSHRHDPAIAASIVKLVQHPDGRYAPPEGHYPFENLVESTYIIRPPWGNAQSLIIPPHKTIEVPLTIPHRTLFPHRPPVTDEDIITFTNHIDSLYSSQLPGATIWTGFGHLFDETPSRFLRQAGRKPVVSSTQHQSPSTSQHTAQPSSTGQYLMQLPSTGQYPGLTAIPATTFVCGSDKGKMVADAETSCQVFHLCHTTGQKESFLCPKGMRFDQRRSQCVHWTKVPCISTVRVGIHRLNASHDLSNICTLHTTERACECCRIPLWSMGHAATATVNSMLSHKNLSFIFGGLFYPWFGMYMMYMVRIQWVSWDIQLPPEGRPPGLGRPAGRPRESPEGARVWNAPHTRVVPVGWPETFDGRLSWQWKSLAVDTPECRQGLYDIDDLSEPRDNAEFDNQDNPLRQQSRRSMETKHSASLYLSNIPTLIAFTGAAAKHASISFLNSAKSGALVLGPGVCDSEPNMKHAVQILLFLCAAVLAKDVEKRQAPYYQKPSPQAYYKKPAAPPQPSYYQPAAQPAYQAAPAPAYYQPAPAPYYQPVAPQVAYQPAPAYYQPSAPAAPAYYQPQAYQPPKPKKPKGQDLSKVPGQAGVDYPIYHEVPDTKFTCAEVPAHPGIYANVDTGCQAYHVCHDGREGHQGASFLCPNGTLFNQHEFACDWWYNVNCKEAPQLYSLNLDPLKNPYAPKPKKEEAPAAGPEYYHP
ncbi:uncharacterized protein LOC128992906 [Macrosteles quadrilineatus]|uniref:uncharacterized protein LOC128992906 n=1 Tax=Macrosteles quadrilineatus TaxID=74068 RepID=UPI0023E306B3|nr:uncharacterized protein LOC128992906 [Macrosteles quadrilineatus]